MKTLSFEIFCKDILQIPYYNNLEYGSLTKGESLFFRKKFELYLKENNLTELA